MVAEPLFALSLGAPLPRVALERLEAQRLLGSVLLAAPGSQARSQAHEEPAERPREDHRPSRCNMCIPPASV